MTNKDIEQASKEIVKSKRGGGKNSPVIGSNGVAPISDSENALFCQYALDMFHSAPVDLSDSDAVASAIDGYFKYCIDRGLRPGNLGLYAALGLSKQDVSNAINGYSNKLRPSTIDLIKKAKQALATYRELLGSQGKLNPVTLIFWQKNYDGLRDVQDINIAPQVGIQQEHTEDEIAQQVLEDIPIDMDDSDTI